MDVLCKLNFHHKQSKVFVPNEIFKDLSVLSSKGSSHIAFAYSYYYLITWLYRYAKYGEIYIDTRKIKRLLGYNPDNKTVNYIIKKNGILDQIGYTSTTNDYPIAWSFEDGEVSFTLIGEMDREYKKLMGSDNERNNRIKYPVKCFHRYEESVEEDVLDGTYYDIGNTHCIPFEVFAKCMEDEKLGVVGFYLYGFLKMKCQIHNGEYNSSIERISEESHIKETSTENYMGRLVSGGLIQCQENDCYFNDGKFKKKANTYLIDVKNKKIYE